MSTYSKAITPDGNYAPRCSIEEFLKDAKQMLYIVEEQSNTFDALIVYNNLVMIHFILLVYMSGKHNGAIDPLFRDVVDDHSLLVG